MAYMSDPVSRLPRRRTYLRTVPQQAEPSYLTAEPVLRLQAAPEEEGFLETMRKIWRRRRLVAACTLVLGGAAALAAWSMPSFYVSEARVLVGISAPRVLNVDAVLADVSPDAERVQNEGFMLQSRNIARQVIDQLKLRDDPEFNPELRKPSFWVRNADFHQFLPSALAGWIDRIMPAKPAEPTADTARAAERRDDRMIDILLSRVDVSTLGRSHVLSVKAEAQNPTTAADLANALAERYLDQQRREKINSMDRVDKFLLGRIAELRDQVRKSDQAVEDYRRTHDLYKSAGSGVTAQQLSELNTQLLAAQTAKAEAEFAAQRGAGDAQGRTRWRECAGGPALSPHHRRSSSNWPIPSGAPPRCRPPSASAIHRWSTPVPRSATCSAGSARRSPRSSTGCRAKPAPPTPATRLSARTSSS